VDDLELIRPYEPNVVKAAWNIFGKSYEYRAKYVAYKECRKKADREQKMIARRMGQLEIWDGDVT
jgi:hypothetical protein